MVEASVDVLEGVVMEVMKEVAVMVVARQVAKRAVVKMVAVMEAVVTVEAMAAAKAAAVWEVVKVVRLGVAAKAVEATAQRRFHLMTTRCLCFE